MSDADYLRNHLLIAMPGMLDGHFDHTVTLLCEHSPDGAMGLVINRPTDLALDDMLRHMDLQPDAKATEQQVFWGGPVQPERGFVLHNGGEDWESTMQIGDELFLTTSRDILDAVASGEGPQRYLVTLGYAGWDAGQLDDEILRNSWLSTPSDADIIFHIDPELRWRSAMATLGVDATLMSGDAGHA